MGYELRPSPVVKAFGVHSHTTWIFGVGFVLLGPRPVGFGRACNGSEVAWNGTERCHNGRRGGAAERPRRRTKEGALSAAELHEQLLADTGRHPQK